MDSVHVLFPGYNPLLPLLVHFLLIPQFYQQVFFSAMLVSCLLGLTLYAWEWRALACSEKHS